MKRSLLLALAVVCVSVAGCGTWMVGAGVVPPTGVVLTDYRAPLSEDNQGVTVGGGKTGTAEVKQYVWIITTGDCSIEGAAKDKGITKINYVDYEYFSVLSGVYSRFAITVHGD